MPTWGGEWIDPPKPTAPGAAATAVPKATIIDLNEVCALVGQLMGYVQHKNCVRMMNPGVGQCRCGLAELKEKLQGMSGMADRQKKLALYNKLKQELGL
jgi:hypothetical protein